MIFISDSKALLQSTSSPESFKLKRISHKMWVWRVGASVVGSVALKGLFLSGHLEFPESRCFPCVRRLNSTRKAALRPLIRQEKPHQRH